MDFFDEMMDNQLDLSKVKDRGNKKWVAMMLPEHLKLIREYVDNQKKIPKPELDEWDLDIIQENIQIAMKRNVDVEVKTWKNGEFNYQIGSIFWVDLKGRTIEMEDVFKSYVIQLDEIVDVTVLE
ncbi:YolD-like family protein [Psychrobacillus sp. FJAT-21963]|uniref:YolD-like family protein n=1 Tax=Psychrobacillus sp. FJAT-21963 TaxID=1712028 RepID=UPI0006FF412A|nr:YolD-like family protein [Psychrobacillus sp. FJAT-21963]